MTLISKIHALLARSGSFLQCPLLLVIRLYWGWQFFLTGKGKLMHLDKTANFFASLNIPMPKLNAIIASCTECSCGLLLLLGLFSRFASLALICVMCVALWTADHDAVVHDVQRSRQVPRDRPVPFPLRGGPRVLHSGRGRSPSTRLSSRTRRPEAASPARVAEVLVGVGERPTQTGQRPRRFPRRAPQSPGS